MDAGTIGLTICILSLIGLMAVGVWVWKSNKRNTSECQQCIEHEEVMLHIKKLNVCLEEGKPFSADAVFGGAMVKIFAGSMINWFKETGGKNYVTVQITDPSTAEQYAITMQKVGGKTPANEIHDLKTRIAELEALQA